MKLGICYMVFDGIELLEFAVKNIRKNIDYISVTYQDMSYFGNQNDINLLPILNNLKSLGLIDEIIHFEPDLSLEPKENELRLRNIGLQASRNAGCSHHISADVDEFYESNQLEYAKSAMSESDYNYSVVPLLTYYKDPTFQVYPHQKVVVSFIHPVHNEYSRTINYPTFPFHMETTRRFIKYDNYKLFNKDEFAIHHMSYVRKDIRKKLANSSNRKFYKKQFFDNFDNYKLGGRVCLIPDFINRKTIQVENKFNIHF